MALNQYNVAEITTHVLDSINQLLAQYQEDIPLVLDNEMQPVLDNFGNPLLSGQIPYVAGRVYIFAQYIQREEFIKWALYTQTCLANAVGATLDRWGVLLDVTRSGLSDTIYRQILQIQVIEYASKGNIPTLIQIYQLVTDAAKVVLTESFPAKFQITALGGSPLIPVANIVTVIKNTKAGGVGARTVLGAVLSFGFKHNPLAGTFGDGTAADALTLKSGAFAGAIS